MARVQHIELARAGRPAAQADGGAQPRFRPNDHGAPGAVRFDGGVADSDS